MSGPKAAAPESTTEYKLTRRDWFVLPALSILTIVVLAGASELTARLTLTKSKSQAEDCMISDASTGVRGIPNSVCWDKVPEGEWTKYSFNSSGYRSAEDFGPKPDGTYRIVMVGTSFATGLRVPLDETFATSLPRELSQRTGRKVQLYNEGIVSRLPDVVAQHFEEISKFKPDMILWVLTRVDVLSTAMDNQTKKAPRSKSEGRLQEAWRMLTVDSRSGMLMNDITGAFGKTRSAYMLRLLLYRSQYLYVKSYLMADDHENGYLRVHPSPEWASRFRQFDIDAAEVERQAHAAGIPVVAVFMPRGPQAAMVSMNTWPAEFDPYRIDNEVRSIIERHGGTFIDILPDYRAIPSPEQDYLRVEGHPNAKGHALISEMLAQKLTDGDAAPLPPYRPQTAAVQGR